MEHLKNALNHQLNPDLMTELHESTFELLHSQVGLGKDFLHAALSGVDNNLPCTIMCVHQFCYTCDVKMEHNMEVPLSRESDDFVMKLFQSAQFTNGERHIINECRIHLRLLTATEMVTGDRRKILPSKESVNIIICGATFGLHKDARQQMSGKFGNKHLRVRCVQHKEHCIVHLANGSMFPLTCGGMMKKTKVHASVPKKIKVRCNDGSLNIEGLVEQTENSTPLPLL